MPRLGPFELLRPVARGGMGVVWQGRHVARDLPVAVKVLTGLGEGAEYSELFRNEVRAVAGLDHPHIVTLYDFGAVTRDAARADSRLAEGCPYLVMEWASGGTLAKRSVRTWRELYGILRQLLDALAHAHARGVIHRDLKPGNVLVCGGEDLRPGLKLADFGIAALHEPDRMIVGTASYMAPEQAAGSWPEQGPWTDLYALGCLAFALITGAPPFRARSPLDVLARSSSALPALPTERALPPGFERWLTRLVHPSPAQRYRAAADAAWALVELDQVAEQFGIAAAGNAEAARDTEVLAADALPTLFWERADDLSSSIRASELPTAEWETDRRVEVPLQSSLPSRPQPSKAGGPATAARPPLPTTWQHPLSAPPSPSMMGAGLALWGLRAVPVVGRLRERDALWAALCRVDATSLPHAVVLTGAAGSGKTRLAQWLAERAQELGAANVLKAVHSPAGGASDGLGPMLARHIRLVGLAGDEATTRVRVALAALGLHSAGDARALGELTGLSEGSAARSPSERHALVTRVVRAIASERPLVVWLEDGQWGADALTWARGALDAEGWERAAILVVVTLRDDLAAPVLLGGERVERIAVEPLGPDEGVALVHELADVEQELAERVEARVAGNPLFAVQLIGDWIRRGLLEAGERGFRLRPGATLELPDDIHAFWSARVDRLLAARPAADARAIEIAAMLGRDVHHDEWLSACAMAGVEPSPELLATMLAEGVAQAGEAGAAVAWSFVHGMLVESLARRVQDTGRHAVAHRACARMLDARGGAPERLVHHLLEAGEPGRALEIAEPVARRRLEQGDFAAVRWLLSLEDRALAALGARDDDLRRANHGVLVADLGFRSGDYEAAERAASEAERVARAHGDQSLLSRALSSRGRLVGARGRFAEAVSILSLAEELAKSQADSRVLADVERGMARALVDSGDRVNAEDRYLRARDYSVAIGDEQGAGISCLGLAECAKQRGDIAGSMRWLEAARAHFEAGGSRWGLANVAMALAENHRHEGQLDLAEREYRESGELFEAIGAGQAIFSVINLGLLALGRCDYAGARVLLERGIEVMRRRKRRSFEGALLLALALCAEGEERDTEAEQLFCDARVILSETSFTDVDTALVAIALGDLAARHGRAERARGAYDVAVGQLEKLGRHEQAATIAEKRASC